MREFPDIIFIPSGLTADSERQVMLKQQWETFKRAARREKMDKIPMALIVDSPWIPGYLGIKHTKARACSSNASRT